MKYIITKRCHSCQRLVVLRCYMWHWSCCSWFECWVLQPNTLVGLFCPTVAASHFLPHMWLLNFLFCFFSLFIFFHFVPFFYLSISVCQCIFYIVTLFFVFNDCYSYRLSTYSHLYLSICAVIQFLNYNCYCCRAERTLGEVVLISASQRPRTLWNALLKKWLLHRYRGHFRTERTLGNY